MDNIINPDSPRQYKGLVWTLLFFGLISLGGAIYSINYRIDSVVPTLLGMASTANDDASSSDSTLADYNEKALLDSDQDGLSDADEELTYDTSPYLGDSDSDGINDGAELAAGTDPNCPTGVDCVRSVTSSTTATTAEGNQVAITDLTPEQLRAQLETAGVPKDVLDSTSDEELIRLYNEAAEQSQVPQISTSTSKDSSEENFDSLLTSTDNVENNFNDFQTIEDLQNLSIDEIRGLLSQGGLTEEEVNSISDSDLQQLYNDQLQNQLEAATQ